MPFGLKNATGTFQRMVDSAFRGLIEKPCLVYLDDKVVFRKTLGEQNKNLVTLLERLKSTGLKLQHDKYEFLRLELEYFGHLITSVGVKPNPDKIASVKSFEVRQIPKQVESFLGLAGYYRKFIKSFSLIAKPLTDLTKKNILFE